MESRGGDNLSVVQVVRGAESFLCDIIKLSTASKKESGMISIIGAEIFDIPVGEERFSRWPTEGVGERHILESDKQSSAILCGHDFLK